MTNRMNVAELRAYERAQWSEQEFTDAVIRLFVEHGWMVHHALASRTAKGYRTAQQGHNGFPDIVAAKGGRVVFAELKVKGRKPTAMQEMWLEALDLEHLFTAFVTVRLWQPKDWDEIEEVARG